MAAIAGIVGEPHPMHRTNDVLVERLTHLEGPEQRANAAGIPIKGPIFVDAELKSIASFGMNLGQILQRLSDAFLAGQWRIWDTVLLPAVGCDHYAFFVSIILAGGRVNDVADREIGYGEAVGDAILRLPPPLAELHEKLMCPAVV